jgi:hypothetical protein
MNKKEDEDVELSQAIASVLEEVAASPMDEMLPSLEEVFFQWLKPHQWLDVWEHVSGQSQLAILEALSWTLPGKVLQDLPEQALLGAQQ